MERKEQLVKKLKELIDQEKISSPEFEETFEEWQKEENEEEE